MSKFSFLLLLALRAFSDAACPVSVTVAPLPMCTGEILSTLGGDQGSNPMVSGGTNKYCLEWEGKEVVAPYALVVEHGLMQLYILKLGSNQTVVHLKTKDSYVPCNTWLHEQENVEIYFEADTSGKGLTSIWLNGDDALYIPNIGPLTTCHTPGEFDMPLDEHGTLSYWMQSYFHKQQNVHLKLRAFRDPE